MSATPKVTGPLQQVVETDDAEPMVMSDVVQLRPTAVANQANCYHDSSACCDDCSDSGCGGGECAED